MPEETRYWRWIVRSSEFWLVEVYDPAWYTIHREDIIAWANTGKAFILPGRNFDLDGLAIRILDANSASYFQLRWGFLTVPIAKTV